jgi:Dyp-type peroxidase family
MTSPLAKHEIQGLILRGYRYPAERHLLFEIENPRRFKTAMRALTTSLTVASDWPVVGGRTRKPEHCLNLGFTFAGLQRVGLASAQLGSFPRAFSQGAVERAGLIPETGASAPEHWMPAFNGGAGELHVVISAFGRTREALRRVARELDRLLAGAAKELGHLDAHRLNDTHGEHFGYADGLSQPTIAGHATGLRDPFPAVPAGEFVLGEERAPGRPPEPLPQPDALGVNGSFAAFRVMAQDVAAFNRFLAEESERLAVSEELIAAKLCGRWRSGEPLMLRPTAADSETPPESWNWFDYEATAPGVHGDPQGLICPRGAHIRRSFPRSQRVIDDFQGFNRRLVRRAMPYGPPYDPAAPDDEERGLVGMFICASLEQQFEYVMRHWLNDGLFTGGRLGRERDPLVGPRFVTTRGSAYLFLPSRTALAGLAGGAWEQRAAA